MKTDCSTVTPVMVSSRAHLPPARTEYASAQVPQAANHFRGDQGRRLHFSARSRLGSPRPPAKDGEHLFVQGKDTSTRQDVGALLDTTRGWGVYGRPSRVSDLERELSKHLVLRLTNAVASMDLCVVHLRRPMGNAGAEKQVEQNRALLRWAMRHLSKNPKANLVILGDFNEARPAGSREQSLAVLFQAKPPMVDALSALPGKVRTHTDGKAYDRIIVSDALVKGLSGLRFESVSIAEHRHGTKENRRLYTDHFPVTVKCVAR